MIIEMPTFVKNANAVMTPNDRQALHLMLAANAFCGAPSTKVPGLYELWLGGYEVTYSLNSNVDVLLLDVTKVTTPPVPLSPADQSKMNAAVKFAAQQGAIALAKFGLKWVWEHVKNNL